MLLFIPRSLCALKRVAAKAEHARYGATQGIRITLASGLYRAEATDGRRAVVVQGLVPIEDPPWPGFKEVPDDACEAVVLPKDLERACKVGEQFNYLGMLGMATMGSEVYLGLGNDVINTRTVEGRFPQINNVMPKKRPMFTFRIDPKLMAETLLAMAELLPETERGVQCFYYGDGYPLGFCAQNPDNGMMIDALVVPLSLPQEPEKRESRTAEPSRKASSGKLSRPMLLKLSRSPSGAAASWRSRSQRPTANRMRHPWPTHRTLAAKMRHRSSSPSSPTASARLVVVQPHHAGGNHPCRPFNFGDAVFRRRSHSVGMKRHFTKPVDLDAMQRLLPSEAA